MTAGRRLGRYEIRGRLGSGGMGEVYRAFDTRLLREVALKVVAARAGRGTEALARLEEEARAASALNHPNICTIHDIAEEHGVPYVVMELIEGESLRQKLGVGVEPKDALSWACQIAAGLTAAHERRIVHCDLKPENVLVTQDGTAKIADFGLARFRSVEASESSPDSDGALTHSRLRGTPGYMAPELIRGEPPDFHADQFSLGAILYEMATGGPAFPGAASLDRLRATLHDDPLGDLRPSLPAGLARVVGRCLLKDPAERHASTRDLRDELGQLRTILGDAVRGTRVVETMKPGADRPLVGAETAGPSSTTATSGVRAKRGWAWLVGGVLLLAILTPSLTRRTPAPLPLRAVAVRPFRVLSEADVPDYYAEGLAESLITALSRVPELKVIAGGSTFDRGLTELTLPELGRRLDVEGVIEGSLQRESDALRATVRLVRVRDGQVVWSGGARSLGAGEWFTLQDQVVAQVLGAMAKPASRPAAPAHMPSTAAHQHYLRARRLLNQRTPDALQEALREFHRALDADPGYAQAQAGLAQSYVLLPFYGLSPPRAAMPRARAAAQEALDLDPALAEAHAVRAVVHYQFEHDWAAAAAAFERALAASPSDATTHQWFAEFLGYAGRFEESRAYLAQASSLDPLSPIVAALRGSPDVWAGRCEAADRHLAEALAFAPDFPLALYSRAVCYRGQGRLDEAIAIYRRLLPRLGEGFVLASLANAEAARGDHVGARDHARALARLSERAYVPPYKFAVIHVGLGEREEAFARLEQAFEASDERLVLLDVDPHMHPLRRDPRFVELRRRVGFPRRPI